MAIFSPWFVFGLCAATTQTKWKFIVASMNKKAPTNGQLSSSIAMSLLSCATQCTNTDYCQSFAYNKNTKECVLQWILSTDIEPVDAIGFQFRDREPPLPQEKRKPNRNILCIGSRLETGNTLEIYNTEQPNNSRSLSAQLPEKRGRHVSVVLNDGRVVIAGGTLNNDENKTTASTELFDPKLDKFTTGPLMNGPRSSAAAALLNNQMVCGGHGQIGSNCEKMIVDDTTGELSWHNMTGMNRNRRYSPAMVELNGMLYAIGGHSDNTAEKYNPQSDTWTYIAPRCFNWDNVGAAVLDEKIYVCGGYDGSAQKDCEVYDPSLDSWHNITSMNKERTEFALEAVNGKLFALGGVPDNKYLVESYDPGSNQWTNEQLMKTARASHSTVILK